MTRIEIIAKIRETALDLATALAEDERLQVVRFEELRYGFRPHPNADVLVACAVSLPPMPAAGPAIVLLAAGANQVRRHVSIRASLPLDATPPEIAAACIAAHAGLYCLPGGQLPPQRDASDVLEEHLTPRELEVLRRLADGLTNKRLATELQISTNTAKFHVAQVLAKLHASSRTEAVQIGIRRGLVLL